MIQFDEHIFSDGWLNHHQECPMTINDTAPREGKACLPTTFFFQVMLVLGCCGGVNGGNYCYIKGTSETLISMLRDDDSRVPFGNAPPGCQ